MKLTGLWLWPCVAWQAAACPLESAQLHRNEVQVRWDVEGGPIEVGRHFALQIQVCPKTATLVRVDASMPEHRHGMNYRPSIKAVAPGRWRVEGMMFHMPGRWELQLDVATQGATVPLQDTFLLP